jgi:hypothetical protein
MSMKSLAFAVAVLLASSLVNAQIYQWKDANGKTVISDKPPVGKFSNERKIEAQTAVSSETSPKSLAEREIDFQKRKQASQEKSDKAKKEENAAAEKKDHCEQMRRNLALLESGERIRQRDEQGEHSFMDDTTRANEIAKARQMLQSSCK